jgi:hypothetical protein
MADDLAALIQVERQKERDATSRAKHLEATVATRSKDGRFARATVEGSHDALISVLVRPVKPGHAGLVAALSNPQPQM